MVFTPQIAYFASLPSTMDEARARAQAGCPEGVAVQADEQTAGRGRLGNNWISPKGNLYITVVLRPPRAIAQAGQLSFVTALALADTFATCGVPGDAIRLKWPNDVMMDGRKSAGILLESQMKPDGRCDFILIGTGVNIVAAPEDRACLNDYATGTSVHAFAQKYMGALGKRYGAWLEHGFDPVREAWLEKAYNLGGTINARLPRETLTGVFTGIDMDGALMLDTADKGPLRVPSAEVHFVPKTT